MYKKKRSKQHKYVTQHKHCLVGSQTVPPIITSIINNKFPFNRFVSVCVGVIDSPPFITSNTNNQFTFIRFVSECLCRGPSSPNTAQSGNGIIQKSHKHFPHRLTLPRVAMELFKIPINSSFIAWHCLSGNGIILTASLSLHSIMFRSLTLVEWTQKNWKMFTRMNIFQFFFSALTLNCLPPKIMYKMLVSVLDSGEWVHSQW